MASAGIPDLWIDAIMQRAYTATAVQLPPTQFKMGNGTTDFANADTDLENPVPITGTEQIDDADATTGWVAGTDSAITLNTTTFQQGTGALNLAKTGTSGTTGSMSKTTTSLDFTSKSFSVLINIQTLADLVASGTAISLRFGSDSSNYFQFDVAIGSLVAGINIIQFTSATATSTTGAPVITACDFTEIIFNVDLAADLMAAGDFIVDDIKLASTDDFFKDFEAVPAVDTSLDQISHDSRVTTIELNGILISEGGSFNKDGTPVMSSRYTFDPFSKSNTDELIISEVTRTTR